MSSRTVVMLREHAGDDMVGPRVGVRAVLDASTPIVPGQQETTATISVTFTLL